MLDVDIDKGTSITRRVDDRLNQTMSTIQKGTQGGVLSGPM